MTKVLFVVLFASLSASASEKAAAVCSGKFVQELKLYPIKAGKVSATWPAGNGFRARKVTYSAMTSKQAAEYGFLLADSQTAFMNAGDDDVPNEYVVLPFMLPKKAGTEFTALAGSNAPDESFDPRDLDPLTCTVP